MKSATEFLGIQGSLDEELELNVYASKVIKWMEDFHEYRMGEEIDMKSFGTDVHSVIMMVDEDKLTQDLIVQIRRYLDIREKELK